MEEMLSSSVDQVPLEVDDCAAPANPLFASLCTVSTARAFRLLPDPITANRVTAIGSWAIVGKPQALYAVPPSTDRGGDRRR